MKNTVTYLFLFLCWTQSAVSQEGDGALPLELPARNSMTFNRYVIHPTFSFVREQNKFISITNKRDLQQLDAAPVTYLASFTGRIHDNMGLGIGAFQQDVGVLTAFGGIANFAYNAQLQRDSNLTFGLNVAAFQSGVNMDRVITNQPDPVLNNIPSNFQLTVSPGINYGTAFMDFGVAVNNAVAYNFTASTLLEENPQQGIKGHIMYTGYTRGYGFFQDSKFMALGQAEFGTDHTELSGSILFAVPKGIWTQAGYNSVHGGFVGLGINLTKEIAIEYNFEKPLGDLSPFGVSHEISLAYRFTNNDYFDFSKEEEMAGLFSFEKKRRKPRKPKRRNLSQEEESALLAAREEQRAKNAARKQAWEAAREERKKQEAQEPLEKEPIIEAQLTAEQEALAQAEAEERAQQEAERQAQREAEEQARLAAEQEALAQAEAEERARQEAERQAQREAEEQARLAAEQEALAQAEAEERARQEAERQAQREAEEQARLAAEQEALAQAERQAQREAEEQARLAAEQEALAQAEAEERARQEAEEQARLAAEQQALAEAKIAEEEIETDPLAKATDRLAVSMNSLLQETQTAEADKNELLQQLREAVAVKNQDLKDLKRENDLSEQGIATKPKPFKSITEENEAIELIKMNLDEVILTYRKKIEELQELYQQRFATQGGIDNEFNQYYQKALKELEEELQAAQREKAQLVSSLQEIAVATEIERKRRIKRAAYNNEDDRYRRDRMSLNAIKQSTLPGATPLTENDFDFGEAQKSNNVQILKNVANTENGYYLVMAVHNSTAERDEFLRKVIAAGHNNVDFFFDVSRSKYYTYYERVERIEDAYSTMQAQDNKPYNKQLSLYKIEN